MSKTVHGTPCWGCSNFTMGEECECNEHLFCDKSLEEHDKQIRADTIDKFVDKFIKRTQLRQMTKSECINTMYDLAEQIKEQK